MPLFTCPRCGKDYLVPLAFCEAFLDGTPMQTRQGSESVYVLLCQECETESQNLLSGRGGLVKDPGAPIGVRDATKHLDGEGEQIA